MENLKNIFYGNKAFIPYITAGDPDLKSTEKIIYTLIKAGADAIELGIPFSDPIADGPVIQAAHKRALQSGTTLKKVINLVKSIRNSSKIPILFMMSFNSIIQFGQTKFVEEIKEAGLNALIVPDLPFEYSGELRNSLHEAGLYLINFVSPTTSQKRLKNIVSKAEGFIYLISSTGVTGVRDSFNTTINDMIKQIKDIKDIPVAVGFGISSPEIAGNIARYSDGVIVGSAIVRLIEKENYLESISNLARSIKQAIMEEVPDK